MVDLLTMSPEYKEHPGRRTILQQIFDTERELVDKSKIAEIGNGLWLHKTEFKPIPNIEPPIHDDTVFGFNNSEIVFMRERKRIGQRNAPLTLVHWILSSEGPPQSIRYEHDWDSRRRSLVIEFLDPHISLGRGGSYSLTDGSYQKMINPWEYFLLRSGPAFQHQHIKIVETRKEHTVHLEGFDNGKLVEEITLPAKVELEKWLPRFFDESDETINDPKMPWQSWFRDLGAGYRCLLSAQS